MVEKRIKNSRIKEKENGKEVTFVIASIHYDWRPGETRVAGRVCAEGAVAARSGCSERVRVRGQEHSRTGIYEEGGKKEKVIARRNLKNF